MQAAEHDELRVVTITVDSSARFRRTVLVEVDKGGVDPRHS